MQPDLLIHAVKSAPPALQPLIVQERLRRAAPSLWKEVLERCRERGEYLVATVVTVNVPNDDPYHDYCADIIAELFLESLGRKGGVKELRCFCLNKLVNWRSERIFALINEVAHTGKRLAKAEIAQISDYFAQIASADLADLLDATKKFAHTKATGRLIGDVLGFMRLNGVEELLCGPALRNSVWQELVRTQRLNSRDSVLLLGESGTGKSFVARFIHENSRRNGDFITLNSAKVKRIDLRKGVDAANAGTLFLDEVHNLHTMRQEELLADVSGPGKKDIRLISASSKPLQRQHSQFMPDFWARVSECVFVLPPLRLHKRDLGEAIKKCCHDNSYIIEDEVLDAMVGGPFTWNNNWRDVEKVLKYLIEKLRMISIHAIDKNAVRRVYDEIHADAKKAMLRVVRS